MRLAFWAIFLGTPVLAIVTLKEGLTLPVMVTGAFVAGGILAQLYIKREGIRVAMTFVFALMLMVVYAGIAFAGCLLVLKGMRF